jgi:UDPglucose 6-dehydrogenase
MNIVVIGTGYVGLVTGVLFAFRGNNVTCVDKNPTVIEQLRQGKVHIYEPGLEPLMQQAIHNGHLTFSLDPTTAVKNADVIFIGVGTPSAPDGTFNLDYVLAAAKDVGKALALSQGFKVVVMKSTVPQGTWQKISVVIDEEVKGHPDVTWAYVSNPETLAEGTAVRDFSSPDRVIIGTDSEEAYELMTELYHPFTIKRDRILRGSPADAELAKLFSNTALASRISLVNEFSRIADVTTGADMDRIRRMVCADERIGFSFMYPSPGYGGSCFPKDVQGLVSQAKKDGYTPQMIDDIHPSNEAQKSYIAQRVLRLLPEGARRVAVWGVTFKPNTDDMRDAASVPILSALADAGVTVVAYDPKDVRAREIFKEKVTFVDEQYAAAKDADALILMTEWPQFDTPDFKKLKSLMKGRFVFDLRNRWLPETANKAGFSYVGIGREYLA